MKIRYLSPTSLPWPCSLLFLFIFCHSVLRVLSLLHGYLMSAAYGDEGLAQLQDAECQASSAKLCWVLFGTERLHQDKAIFFF